MPWIGGLAFGGLQRSYAARRWRADDISTSAADFRDPLLHRREVIAQRLELIFEHDRKLLERVSGLRELIASCRGLLTKRAEVLFLLQHGLLAALELQIGHRTLCGQLRSRRDEG